MALRETFPYQGEMELCVSELGERTRRDLSRPRTWAGLSAVDTSLLVAWVGRERKFLGDFHTDVELGCIPCVDQESGADWYRRLVRGTHPLRVDCVAKWRDEWWVLEVKPDAGYIALGQVLTYGYWAASCIQPGRNWRMGVVTDWVQRCIEPVYKAIGVKVLGVGAVIDEQLEALADQS